MSWLGFARSSGRPAIELRLHDRENRPEKQERKAQEGQKKQNKHVCLGLVGAPDRRIDRKVDGQDDEQDDQDRQRSAGEEDDPSSLHHGLGLTLTRGPASFAIA